MVPFLFQRFGGLYKNLVRLFLKPDGFDNLSGNDLLHVNLIDKSIYLKRKDIQLGFEIGQVLKILLSSLLCSVNRK